MPHPLSRTPNAIVAVHLNYRSRARQRGRTPAHPSFFLKPPSSLAGSGDPVARPRGCELLTFEGEIALVIGERARNVPTERAFEHVGWVTAANDFGVYDLRYADLGSNLRSKGADGFTPVGPRLLDARALDPRSLRLRTWVNGELAQDALVAEELIFGFDLLVADLSRFVTLEPGDVILTGTPAGSTVVEPGDVVEVEVTAQSESTGRLTSPIVEAEAELAPIGAMPKADAAARQAALGSPPRPLPDAADEAVLELLAGVATATLSSQLRQRGLEHVAMEGLRPTRPERKLVGRARTLRYLPLREDLFAVRAPGMNAQKQAVEQVEPGDVLVIDARREAGAGTIGDILALRVQARGGAGIVTDGALRDSAAIAALDLPVYHAAVHPAVLGRRHVPWEAGVAVSCAGVLVQPGDLIVGDADGVVVCPPELAHEVAAAAAEQERQERFIAERVAAGEPIEGLYPLGPAWRPAYEEWCARQDASTEPAPTGRSR
ncbi:MAG TPA: fumarylacetoacetate hydrolase family protein [Gaiellaceae bacterium]|nr:fumarylacetoacetate hydrolase family protein [Gaiellaceae bacterium]